MLDAGKTTWCIFDPPYRNSSVSGHPTIDHEELVSLLLKARYRWVLSEEEDPIYYPLGEPVARFTVTRTMKFAPGTTNKRLKAVECLWSNFEAPVLQSLDLERKPMPKIEIGDLLAQLRKDRDEIDATIKVLTRTVARNYSLEAVALNRKAPVKKLAPKKKGRVYTQAQKDAMSAKLRASWATRKRGKK